MIDAASSPSCHLFLILLIGLNFECAVQILYLVVYSHYFLFLKGFLTPTFYSSCVINFFILNTLIFLEYFWYKI